MAPGYCSGMPARGERIVTVLAGALFLFGAVVALVDPKEPFTAYRQPVVIGATVVLVLVGLLWRTPTRARRWCAWRWTGPSVAVFAGVVALATGLSMRLAYSWDVRIVLDVAGRLHARVPLTRYEQGYVTRYPNNTAMVALERLAYDVAGATGWPVVVILLTVAAIGVGVTVWAVHRMVLPIGGPVRAVVAQLVSIVLVAASPWVAIPYTDVFALPLLSGALLLAMTAMRRRHDAWALLLAVAAGSSLALAAGSGPSPTSSPALSCSPGSWPRSRRRTAGRRPGGWPAPWRPSWPSGSWRWERRRPDPPSWPTRPAPPRPAHRCCGGWPTG